MLPSSPPHPPVWVNLEEPLHLKGARDLLPLNCPSKEMLARFAGAPTPGAPIVATVGGQLLEALSEHPAIRMAIQAALTSQDAYPIYLRMSAPAAAEYPWESLFDSDGNRFLAL